MDTRTPVLSGQLHSDVRGAQQSAFQILVSDSEKKLSKGIGNMWDTGKVMSAESLGAVYTGLPLESGKRYYWKVRVWDNDGAKTKWSDSGIMQMGLLEQEDWGGADWIALEAAEKDEILLPGYNPGYSQLTERGLTPTAIYYHDLIIMEQTAKLLGKDEEAAHYANLAAEVKKAFICLFPLTIRPYCQ